MDGANVNGGNAEAPREDSNLENSDATVLTAETRDSLSSKTQSSADGNAEAQEVNGDVKGSSRKPGAVSLRRKMRKSKANSTSTVESDGAETLGVSTRKRKHSEFDDASSEDSEFNGFDSQVLELQPGSLVLKKLIAEAEIAEAQYVKRIRYSNRSFDGREKKEDDQDIDDMRAYIYETDSLEDVGKVKKESDKSETDSMDISNSIDSEAEPSKIEDISMRSANSSSAASSPSAASQRSKSSRFSRGLSPGGKHRSPIDMSNPLYKEPFKYGWKRELVFRATNDSAFKRMADIYYYTPKGKKVRSFREVAESLNSKELTIDNFTFFKEPIGLDDPEKEIIRDAKRIRGSGGYTTGRKSFGRKSIAAKKPVPEPVVKKPVQEPVTRRSAQESAARKSVQEPLASVPAPAPAPTPAPTPVTEASKLTPPVSVPTRAATKAKASTSPAYKTKAAAKKTPQIKMKSAAEEPEMLPPQRSTPNTRRNQQAVEKVTSVKTKRLLTPKVQEPCSIRCSTSMGLIPSLQCRVCLCLYHPECVDGMEFAGSDEYVCKNCQPDTKESHTSNNPSLTPPPLIPISMLGAQNTKSKHQTNSAPPKLQRIPKSDGADTQTRNSSRISKTPSNVGSKTMSNASSNVDRTEAAWFPQTENEFLQSHDGDVPKPAQNIAVMGGKRYIVVPKNNAMAVQPARVKPDKIGDKPPILPDGSLTDISNTVDNSAVKSRTVPPKSLNDDPPEKANITPDEEITKDDSTLSTDFASSAITETETFDSKDNKDDKDNSPKEDQSIEDISVENESSTASIVDCVPEKENADLNCKSPDNKSACTPTSIASTANTIDEANVEIIQTDDQQLLSSKEGTVKKVKHSKRKQMSQQETEQQQNFMGSVCAGYHALLRIFQYLKVQELLRAARVCKMWRDLAAHPSLWKTVRMKNSQVTDWDGLADTLQRRGTQHLDLRKMLVSGESDNIWRKFLTVIPRVTSLVKLELCRCPVIVVEEVLKSCPQLEVLSAMAIKCDSLTLESVGNLKRCQELRLKAISGMSLQQDLTPLQDLTHLMHLSLTSVKELGKKKIDVIQTLTNLETLELGECSDFPDKFGTTVLIKLSKLERLRLEKGQGSCCTFDILEGVSKLENLNQMELVNFDVKNGFDKCLANCKNIKRLLIIPTYISQSATSNNMVLGGVTELSNNLTHFVWGVTLELLRVTELFVDQCNLMSKQVTGDSIPVLKPVPCLRLIADVEDENDYQKSDDKQQPHQTSPQVDILPLPQLQKLLLTALPKTRVKILKIPFHATWRQSISDTAAQ
ncbi:uro-adherence factor A isoform X2 [Linepithema humile]|uniref:uro-adherence factor A isoform X2 n=1 Tax=Linepithema humile TaxID=83485 RepID=UPI00351E3C90